MRNYTKISLSLLVALVVAALATTASAYDFIANPGAFCYKITGTNPPTVTLTYQKTYANTNNSARYDNMTGIVDITVHIKGLESSNADLMLDSTFESVEALKGYAVHPDHVAVADGKVRPYTAIRSCLDFEI